MVEAEVNNAKDAVFFLANEVVNEYHSFRVVQRADFPRMPVGAQAMFIEINGNWYQLNAHKVGSPELIQRLENLANA